MRYSLEIRYYRLMYNSSVTAILPFLSTNITLSNSTHLLRSIECTVSRSGLSLFTTLTEFPPQVCASPSISLKTTLSFSRTYQSSTLNYFSLGPFHVSSSIRTRSTVMNDVDVTNLGNRCQILKC
jgi:hypothetical protein